MDIKNQIKKVMADRAKNKAEKEFYGMSEASYFSMMDEILNE